VARREQKKLEFRNNNNRWEKNRPKYYNKGYKKHYGRPYQKPYEKKEFYKYEQREERKKEIFTPFEDNSKNEKEFELNASKREDLSSETKVRKKYIPKPPSEN
jgi:pyruvate-formate lyase